MKKVLLIFTVLLGIAAGAQAQFSQFHVGLAFPTGKFGDGDERRDDLTDGKGFAAMGFTIGYKRYNPVNVENLSWVIGIQAFYNGLNSDYKDEAEDDWNDVTFMKYLNLPVTAGLNYAFPLAAGIKLYGEGALGMNFSMPTKYSLADSRSNYQDVDIKVTPQFGFAYALEGGVFINNKYSVGLRYNHLGTYKYKYEVDYETASSTKEKYDKALPITNLTLCFGFLF